MFPIYSVFRDILHWAAIKFMIYDPRMCISKPFYGSTFWGIGNIKITRAKCINELLFFEKSLGINQYIIRYCSFAIIWFGLPPIYDLSLSKCAFPILLLKSYWVKLFLFFLDRSSKKQAWKGFRPPRAM